MIDEKAPPVDSPNARKDGDSNPQADGDKLMLAYLAARNVNKFDALLPLLVHLRASLDPRSYVAYTIVLFENVHEDIERSGFHLDALRELSSYYRPFSGARLLGPLRGLFKLGALVWLFAKRRMSGYRIVVLLPWQLKGLRDRFTIGVLSGFAKVYEFPGLQTPATADFMKRFEHWGKLQEIGVKRAGKVNFVPKYPPICYLDSEKQYLTRPGQADPVAIGIPRLYGSWIPFVQSHGSRHVSMDLAAAGLNRDLQKYGVVVLTNPRYHWFPNGDSDYPAMLHEIVAASKRHFPAMPILLKPKANMRRLFDELLTKEGILGNGVYVVDTGLAALSSRAVWAASINESSGVFDFLTSNVPAIEYARYAPHWLEITPRGSAWRTFPGLRYVESVDQLDAAMHAIAMRADTEDIRKQLAEHLKHREDLSFLRASPAGSTYRCAE